MSDNAKRRNEKLSLKQILPSPTAKAEPRYATREMMQKALKRVMELHGDAFRRLAE